MWLSFWAPIIFWISILISAVNGDVLHTNDRWIVDSKGERVKFRCVNWAGASEVNIPEGLASQPVAAITAWIKDAGFNCVRLTYSIDMALNPNQKVSDSFTIASSTTGTGSNLTALYHTAVAKNPWLAFSTTRGAFAKVLSSLNDNGIRVILDNHNSHASWCCSDTDGNGWWASASGYNAANSRYFITSNWLSGLASMATFAKSHPNVVGLSLRNELRATGLQDLDFHADWYKYVQLGATAIHTANTDALVVIGGVDYATNMSYLYTKPIDKASLGLADKIVWEFHSYSWSNAVTGICDAYAAILGGTVGYLLESGKPFTGPLWLSEFGWTQVNPTAVETAYVNCLSEYMSNNDADWSYWALQGNYYVREGVANSDEGFGLLNNSWNGWRNPDFVSMIGKMWTKNQGP